MGNQTHAIIHPKEQRDAYSCQIQICVPKTSISLHLKSTLKGGIDFPDIYIFNHCISLLYPSCFSNLWLLPPHKNLFSQVAIYITK